MKLRKIPRRRGPLLLSGLIGLVLVVACCNSRREQPQPASPSSEPVVVTAPVAGVIRTVLVSDDDSVNQGAALLEISMPPEISPNTDSSGQKSARGQKSDLKLAETEMTRAQTRVQQIQDLVAKGYASQAELDDARVKYQEAQKHLQEMRNSTSSANNADHIAKKGGPERTIAVLAPSTGKVRIISAQAGQAVRPGQELFQIEKSME